MLRVLGLNGSLDPLYPSDDPEDLRMLTRGLPLLLHDSAAALVCDGEVVAAIEEERLSRNKHTNRLPIGAVRFCLDRAGCTLDDIDQVAYYLTEVACRRILQGYMRQNPAAPRLDSPRQVLSAVLQRHIGGIIGPEKINFVEHHLAHAMSAYVLSPFAEALVITLDGEGDGFSGTVSIGSEGRLTRIAGLPIQQSLGNLYNEVIGFIGYPTFNEYKVMGLAPYGDPARFRHLFDEIVVLQPAGQYVIAKRKIAAIGRFFGTPRQAGAPFTQQHKDLAAALQEAIERAALHLVRHYRHETGMTHLCLSGGVAHNSSMVGKLLREGLFDKVFVQPASHDAGCALGAALAVHREREPSRAVQPLKHVYLGPDIGGADQIDRQLAPWMPFVEVRRMDNPAGETAQLLSDDVVIGWVQGRSEFGPRALGNRSILADARPAENKDRINDLVKKREGFRPFAPVVLEEHAEKYFELPPGGDAAFMGFVVPVREEARSQLGAVTHVDGTARVQTVSRAVNPRLWDLIEAFRARAGVPVLLNTSFNSSVEPIVDSVDDAVVCLLTTGLSHLVVGDVLITKEGFTSSRLLDLVPMPSPHVRIIHARRVARSGDVISVYECENLHGMVETQPISAAAYEVLAIADGCASLRDIIRQRRLLDDRDAIVDELFALWQQRLIRLRPSQREKPRTTGSKAAVHVGAELEVERQA